MPMKFSEINKKTEMSIEKHKWQTQQQHQKEKRSHKNSRIIKIRVIQLHLLTHLTHKREKKNPRLVNIYVDIIYVCTYVCTEIYMCEATVLSTW